MYPIPTTEFDSLSDLVMFKKLHKYTIARFLTLPNLIILFLHQQISICFVINVTQPIIVKYKILVV